MLSQSKLLAAVLSVSLLGMGAGAGCGSSDDGTERWATTENTNVNINWDKVNEAYKAAEGPEDLERRINEIYEGKEIISVSVQDTDDKTQVVTGFFDHNKSGSVDEGEKIFTIKREVTGEGAAQYQTHGHGHYAGYASPYFSLASGMLMGAMMSSMFMPSYVPMYAQPYTTTAARAGALQSQRSAYRQANPSKFAKSKSGRSYGTGRSSGGRSRGGGGFGLHRRGRAVRPERLTA